MAKLKRGRDSNGKKMRWSSKKKEKQLNFMLGGSHKVSKPAKGSGKVKKKSKAEPVEDGMTRSKRKMQKFKEKIAAKKAETQKAAKKKKKGNKPKPEKKRDEAGDELVEHDLFDSEDDEEDEIKAAEEEKQRLERERIAKGHRTAFVCNLPWSVDEEALRRLFAKCGTIEEMNLPKTAEGKPRGIAFVTFSSEQEVAKALAFNESDYEARKIKVDIAGRDKEKKKKARQGGGGDSDDEEDSYDDEESQLNSDDEPSSDDDGARSKGKGKGKGKSKGKSKGKGKGKDKGKSKGKESKGNGKSKGKGTGKGQGSAKVKKKSK
eukprot:TRINITY_DN12824_c0_g1_i1.p1 TRINITY_DN12824_c0_g1~~TRINITY_DN12824_c0_g1_i1.p1  ORF type:complete len:320 (+),score=124.17 TRINITY_DN12824_c0_g1_i1:71-1030(+)